MEDSSEADDEWRRFFTLISEADEGAGEGIVEALKKVVKGEEGNVVHVTNQLAFQGAVAANGESESPH